MRKVFIDFSQGGAELARGDAIGQEHVGRLASIHCQDPNKGGAGGEFFRCGKHFFREFIGVHYFTSSIRQKGESGSLNRLFHFSTAIYLSALHGPTQMQSAQKTPYILVLYNFKNMFSLSQKGQGKPW
jgi:hypothetical protein